jgi:hypothetical protein
MLLIWEATPQIWVLSLDPGRSDGTPLFRHAPNPSPTLAVDVIFAMTVPYMNKAYTSPKKPIIGRRAEFPTVPQFRN